MARFRQHRGSLADSLKTTVDVADVAALKAHIRMLWECTWWAEARLDPETITIKPYSGDDDRCGWKNVHVVSDAAGVIGFVEGDVLAPPAAAAAAECQEWCGQELADGRVLRCERCDGRFRPSARQLDLMEHAVGGDSRHRNYFAAGGDDYDLWRQLVAAGLAETSDPKDFTVSNLFSVSPAGVALLDARARPRILEAKARAWDAFKASAREVLVRLAEDRRPGGDDAADALDDFVRFIDLQVTGDIPAAPTPKGPRAIAEEIVIDLATNNAGFEAELADDDVRARVEEGIAEIISKALAGES